MRSTDTFGEKVLDFYKSLPIPNIARFNLNVINPHANKEVWDYINNFYAKFYNDNRKRIFIFGINPGRFGSGITGIPFTDPIVLEKQCEIGNTLTKRKELSSSFLYGCIDAFGGTKKFFEKFYLTAISPIGFTKQGKNYNYYDDNKFFNSLRPFLIDTTEQQISFGANKDAVIILGTGKNLKAFESINNEKSFFKKIYALEHPRYIMQYKKNKIDQYIEKYISTFKKALLK